MKYQLRLQFDILGLGDQQCGHGGHAQIGESTGDNQCRLYSQYWLGVIALLPSKGEVSTVSRSGRLVTPRSLYKDVTRSGYPASLFNSGWLQHFHGFSRARLGVGGGEDQDQHVRLELGLES